METSAIPTHSSTIAGCEAEVTTEESAGSESISQANFSAARARAALNGEDGEIEALGFSIDADRHRIDAGEHFGNADRKKIEITTLQKADAAAIAKAEEEDQAAAAAEAAKAAEVAKALAAAEAAKKTAVAEAGKPENTQEAAKKESEPESLAFLDSTSKTPIGEEVPKKVASVPAESPEMVAKKVTEAPSEAVAKAAVEIPGSGGKTATPTTATTLAASQAKPAATGSGTAT